MRRTLSGLMVVVAGAYVGGGAAGASPAMVADRPGMERPLEVVRADEATERACRSAAERRRETIDALFAKLKSAKPSASHSSSSSSSSVSPSHASSPSLSSVAVLPPAAGKPEKNSTPSASRHTVQPGETLAAIARRFYGHAGAWETIAAANGIADPSAVTAGRTLILPPASGTTAAFAQAVAAPPAPVETPRVRPVLMTDRSPVLNRFQAPSEQSLDYATYDWRVYHVQPGETLSSLAERFLGGAAQASVLARFNQIGEGSVLPAGSGLLVPQPKRPEMHERYLLSTQGIFR